MNYIIEIQRFEQHMITEEKSAATIDKYLRDIRGFCSYLTGQRISKEKVIAYKEHLTGRYAPASVNSMLIAINRFLRFLGLRDCCVRLLKIQRQMFCNEDKELTKQELHQLVKAAGNTRLSLVIQTICGTGRPRSEAKWTSKYMDSPLTPLFPFGYGLSYTAFTYGALSLQVQGDRVTASVPVTNSGDMAGEETVQLYIHRRRAQRVRPVREFKGYQKVFLQPKETRTVSMTLTKGELGYYTVDGSWCTEESDFDLWLAHDSVSGPKGTFRL